MIDIHTHVWEYPAHVGQRFADDCHAAWGDRVPPGTTLEAHWAAMEPVERAVVFGLQARASDIYVPNDYVAGYVSQHPKRRGLPRPRARLRQHVVSPNARGHG